MDFLSKLGNSVVALLTGLGAVVDAAIPVAHGDRTKIAALAAIAAKVGCAVASPFAPQACPVIDGVANGLTALVPLLAFAGLVRKPVAK